MLKKLKEKLSKKENNIIQIGCPIEGEVVSIKEVNDPTFSQEMLGKGIAIKPNKGRVVAPIDGEIAMIFETKHAVSILTEQGAEIFKRITYNHRRYCIISSLNYFLFSSSFDNR